MSNLRYMYTFSLTGFYYVNAEQLVDVEISEDLKNMVKISIVSNPVVTAVESNFIWFVKSWG